VNGSLEKEGIEEIEFGLLWYCWYVMRKDLWLGVLKCYVVFYERRSLNSMTRRRRRRKSRG